MIVILDRRLFFFFLGQWLRNELSCEGWLYASRRNIWFIWIWIAICTNSVCLANFGIIDNEICLRSNEMRKPIICCILFGRVCDANANLFTIFFFFRLLRISRAHTTRSYKHWIVGNLFFYFFFFMHFCIYGISINDKCNESAVGWVRFWVCASIEWDPCRPRVCACISVCVTFRMFQRNGDRIQSHPRANRIETQQQ